MMTDSAQLSPGPDDVAEMVGELDGADGELDAERGNLYTNVAEFVERFLAIVYARPVGAQVTGFRWCPRWWEHAEAVSRLESLWKAFEALRSDPGTGPAVWWRDYADPTMAALCGPEGAFKACSPEAHKVQPDLPLEPPPPGFAEYGEPSRGAAP